MASSSLKVGTNQQDMGMSTRVRAVEVDGLRYVVEASRQAVERREANGG